MLSGVYSKLRNTLPPQTALELAKGNLENAHKAKNSEMALAYCREAEAALSRIRTSARKTCVSSSRMEDRHLCNEIAATYLELGDLLDSLKHHGKAQASYTNGEKWGGRAQLPGQSSSRTNDATAPPAADLASDHAVDLAANPSVDPAGNPSAIHAVSLDPPPRSLIRVSTSRDIATIPPHIFAKDMDQPPGINKLPKVGERLENVSQLVHCLTLLQLEQFSEDALDLSERKWIEAIEHDSDEYDRLRMLAINMLKEFTQDEFKDANVVAEVVCLVPVLEKHELQKLLKQLFHGIEQSELLDFDLLEGLAQLVRRTRSGHLNADNLVKILELISRRLEGTHSQSPDYINQLTLTVSRVLDVMADTKVKGLDRVDLHAPLAAYLRKLEGGTDPHLVYQAAYASQALMYVPDDETLWQTTQRRTGKVVKGVAGLVSGVKGLDLIKFVEGLSHIQEGLAGAEEVFTLVKNAYEDVSALATSGQQFLNCLQEGLSFSHKRAWYPALRGADVLLRNGQLVDFKRLVCEASCRRDPVFQWGLCQRLGELASNDQCDEDSRASAVAFLGEMYQCDEVWGHYANIKQLVLDILMQLSASPEREANAAKALLQELEMKGDGKKQALYRTCLEGGPGAHRSKVALRSLLSKSLLDRVQQNNIDAETRLCQLKVLRLEEREKSVYISPQAKASLKASDDNLFPLMDKVKEFLESERKVFLVMGDSGAGKSTFNRGLECDLWSKYKKNIGRIPLFITLAAIRNPEDNMVAKQLQKEGFTESQIQELKDHRDFILICDGYDEGRQMHNLYNSNELNLRGGWRAQMVISCRSEYLNSKYRNHFQPGDRNRLQDSPLFEEAVIAPFTMNQIQDYVEKFVSSSEQQWKTDDYLQALNQIPGLRDLVTNPFLLTLSLEVLPGMVDSGQNLSAARITRVTLYDRFVEQWLDRGYVRLVENVSDLERDAFERLSDEGGFTQKGIEYLKGLATAIFLNQSGSSVVEYPSVRDQGKWKEAFFGRETKLLREACPLQRSGDQYRFLHQSLLEYGLARAVFEPQKRVRGEPPIVESTATVSRRGSINTDISLENQGVIDEVSDAIVQPVLESPLGRRSFVGEPSILRFLAERVQQEPLFKKQLLAVIEQSKAETIVLKTVRRASANAITILIRSGEQFNGVDLQGIRIPGADLSHGSFEYAQLQRADMRNVILRGASLHEANLGGAQMTGVQFGELPFLEEERLVGCCVYSPDGGTFAVGLNSGNISIYRTSDWKKTKTLSGHSGSVLSVVYSPKGDQIASGSWDETVRLWDVGTGDCHHTLTGHSDFVTSVVYSPKGDQIASGSEDKTVRLWDIETGDCHRTLSGHNDRVLSVVYSAKGDHIASGSDDGTVRLWDVKTGDCCQTLSGHSSGVSSVVYSPKGDQIASGSSDETVRLWDVETGDCHQTLSGHSDGVASVVYSPKGDQIASGSLDKTVRLWNVETGECRQTLSGHSGIVSSVVYSPKGDQIASGSWDSTVRLWDVETGDSRQTLSGHSSRISSVVHSPKGDQIASGSEDKTMRLWDVETGDCNHTLTGHSDYISSVVYSPNGDQMASCSDDGTVRLWNVGTGDCRQTLSGHKDHVLSVMYSPNGDQIASGSDDATVRLWDVETGDCRQTLTGHSSRVSNAVYSPNGNQIASGSWDKTVRLWDVGTGDCRRTLSGHSSRVSCVVYSPNGDQIASGSWDKTVRLWDVGTGDCRHTLSGHSSRVSSVVYSPKGDQIASGSEDTTVRLWDVETGDCRHALTGHSERVSSVVYSPKGDQIASASSDATVRLWDIELGGCLVVIQNCAGVNNISWRGSYDSSFIVAGCDGGLVRLWRVIEDGNECCVRLHWRSQPEMLTLLNTSIQDVEGLDQRNKQLLLQRGAVGEPAPL